MQLLFKQIWSHLKPYCRWVILGGTVFFLAKALKDHWQEVAVTRITATGWATLVIALGVTLLAHTWSGWVWTWILRELNQPVNASQFVQVYLKTNIAKYLPGNVWHYYGRISAAMSAGVSASAATLSVLLEPLLMAAAALVMALLSGSQSSAPNSRIHLQALPVFGLVTVLIAVHPRFLNVAISFLGRLKAKALKGQHASSLNGGGMGSPLGMGGDPRTRLAPEEAPAAALSKLNSTAVKLVDFQLQRYPLRPLLGELGFIALRGAGFLLTVLALGPLNLNQIPLLMGAFSLAWLLGLVVPGAPGGLGIFEATAIALLDQSFSPGLIISAIALYRLVSVLAESAGAALAWLDEHRKY